MHEQRTQASRVGQIFDVRRHWRSVATLLLAWALSGPAFAAQVSLAWNASTSTAVTGYYVYYGTASRNYPNRVGVGNVTSYTVPNLNAGQTYYFAVTAHDASMAESPHSNEVFTTTPSLTASTTTLASTPNPSIVGTNVTFTATVNGSAPTGTVSFRAGAATIGGCSAVALAGSGNVRTATCTTAGLSAGTHGITASYSGNAANTPSASAPLSQFVHATPAAASFADVPADHWAYAAIEALAYHGITLGCATNPQQFCPDGLVSRAEMAVFLERAMKGPGFVYAPTGTRFADVPLFHWAVGPIEQLYLDGVTSGCATAPLRFCPTESVTRASMAKFLLLAKLGAAYNPGTASGTVFADVPATHWVAAWIEAFHGLGYTTGCASNPLRFCPDVLVSRAEMAVFLYRVFDLPDPP